MPIDDLHVLTAAVFGAVLLFLGGVHRLFVDGATGRRDASRRLRALSHAPVQGESAAPLRRKPRERLGLSAPFDVLQAALDRLISQSGIGMSVRHVVLGTAGFGFVSSILLVASVGVGEPILAVATAIAGFALGVALLIAGLLHLRARRLARFAGQLPEALDIMVRSLRSGHPVSAAMAMVGREMAEPIGGEFRTVIGEMTYGLDLRDTLANLAQRIAVPDLQYLVVAITLQHETGGNLAEVLYGLAAVIRARVRMIKKTRALSAEGRLSARVLAALPFLFAGLVFISRPDFYLSVADDPLFFPALGIALGLEFMGIYAMHRMVSFHV